MEVSQNRALYPDEPCRVSGFRVRGPPLRATLHVKYFVEAPINVLFETPARLIADLEHPWNAFQECWGGIAVQDPQSLLMKFTPPC